jgi:hypothetical protein
MTTPPLDRVTWHLYCVALSQLLEFQREYATWKAEHGFGAFDSQNIAPRQRRRNQPRDWIDPSRPKYLDCHHDLNRIAGVCFDRAFFKVATSTAAALQPKVPFTARAAYGYYIAYIARSKFDDSCTFTNLAMRRSSSLSCSRDFSRCNISSLTLTYTCCACLGGSRSHLATPLLVP